MTRNVNIIFANERNDIPFGISYFENGFQNFNEDIWAGREVSFPVIPGISLTPKSDWDEISFKAGPAGGSFQICNPWIGWPYLYWKTVRYYRSSDNFNVVVENGRKINLGVGDSVRSVWFNDIVIDVSRGEDDACNSEYSGNAKCIKMVLKQRPGSH